MHKSSEDSMSTSMPDQSPNEETPLMGSAPIEVDRPQKRTPLPMGQIAILLLVQMAEPITSQSILPFINQLISELDITGGDERKVGYYAGLVESLFFAAEALMVLQWSRLSDRIGRKPVLISGLLGLTISMLWFGLSRTFWTVVLSRAFAGATNGNIAVMKSMMAEVSDETNIAQAFSLMPVVWATGTTIGPFMGGVFSRPYDRFPGMFGSQFWERYPYFLPCAIAAGYCMISFVTAAVFLKETLPTAPSSKRSQQSDPEQTIAVYGTEEGAVVERGETQTPLQVKALEEKPVSLQALLTKPVLISVANYGFLALLDIALGALAPLFYSTPIELGGLGLPPATIGLCMGAFGVMNGVFQGIFFSRIIERLGPKRLFITGMASFVPIFALFPASNLLARRLGLSHPVWLTLAIQLATMVVMDMSYGCIFIYITSASLNKRSLGATNGFAQTVISVVRTIGPAMSTSLFALTTERHILGGYGVYIILMIITADPCWWPLISLMAPGSTTKNMWKGFIMPEPVTTIDL